MTKKTDNLPAVIKGGGTFPTIAVDNAGLELDPELQAAINDEDYEGYEDDGQAYPIVEIRQKDAKDDKGKTAAPAGGFKMYDPVLNGNSDQIPDVDGEKGLFLSILGDQSSRVYFPTVGETPSCRSLDGIRGEGTPGGDCAACPLSKMENGNRAKCKAQKNLFAYDHVGNRAYVLRLGPSGLTPWKNFKALMKRLNVPVGAAVIKVTSLYVNEPAPHYVPVFASAATIPADKFIELRSLRKSAGFVKAVEVVTDETPEAHEVQDTDYEELPPDVEPVERANNDDDGLPF